MAKDVLSTILQQALVHEQRPMIQEIIEAIFYNKPDMDEKGLSFTILLFLPKYPYSDYFKGCILYQVANHDLPIRSQSDQHDNNNNYLIVDDRLTEPIYDDRDWLLEWLKYPHCFKAITSYTDGYMQYTCAQCTLFQTMLSITEQKRLGYERASAFIDYVCDIVISIHFRIQKSEMNDIQHKWNALTRYDMKLRNKYGFYKDPRMIAIHLLGIFLNDNKTYDQLPEQLLCCS